MRTQPWMYQPNYRPPITPQDFFFCMWLETQPCLNYESVQNDKLFILSFAKVEPLVKHADCIYYSYSYLILTIFICIEKSICIFVKKKKINLYINKLLLMVWHVVLNVVICRCQVLKLADSNAANPAGFSCWCTAVLPRPKHTLSRQVSMLIGSSCGPSLTSVLWPFKGKLSRQHSSCGVVVTTTSYVLPVFTPYFQDGEL